MDFKPNEFFRGLEEFITMLLPGPGSSMHPASRRLCLN